MAYPLKVTTYATTKCQQNCIELNCIESLFHKVHWKFSGACLYLVANDWFVSFHGSNAVGFLQEDKRKYCAVFVTFCDPIFP